MGGEEVAMQMPVVNGTYPHGYLFEVGETKTCVWEMEHWTKRDFVVKGM